MTALLGAIVGAFMTGWIVLLLWIIRSQLDLSREIKMTGASKSEISHKFSSELWYHPDRAADRAHLVFVLKCAGIAIALTAVAAGFVLLRDAFLA
jgi:hypothetical protein